MLPLETERLILRKFNEDDFAAVHSYASSVENIIYMPWGPNSEEQTRAYISLAISEAERDPICDYHYAVVLKNTNGLIGGCGISTKGNEASLGWLLHRNYWRQGYGTEMGKALLRFGFEELDLHRICAMCDVENYGSYRVMERIGMRREGLFVEGRPANKLSDREYGDELSYAILRDEWEAGKGTPAGVA